MGSYADPGKAPARGSLRSVEDLRRPHERHLVRRGRATRGAGVGGGRAAGAGADRRPDPARRQGENARRRARRRRARAPARGLDTAGAQGSARLPPALRGPRLTGERGVRPRLPPGPRAGHLGRAQLPVMARANYDFHGRTALITGGAGGIGAAVARTLLSGGARVATFDSRPADLDGVLAIDGDVRRSEDLDAAVARVGAELGPLDIAVCAAGVSGDSLATVDVGDDEWRRVFSINCDGVFFTNRAAARVMVPRGYGRIVNIASIAGKEGNPMAAAYSGSKGAVIAFTKSIGKD